MWVSLWCVSVLWLGDLQFGWQLVGDHNCYWTLAFSECFRASSEFNFNIQSLNSGFGFCMLDFSNKQYIKWFGEHRHMITYMWTFLLYISGVKCQSEHAYLMKNDWLEVRFLQRWWFPNCISTLHEKHVFIDMPAQPGSTDKEHFSSLWMMMETLSQMLRSVQSN